MIQDKTKRGFTLIELSISLTFISILLVAIAMTIIQISGSYNRGLTIKSVNLAASSIATELQRSIATTMPFSVESNSTKYVVDSYGGRLCLDKYSYIWNYGKSLNTNSYRNKYSSGSTLIRFVKVPDTGGSYCTNATTDIDPTNAVDLLSSGDRNLAIHLFQVASGPTAFDQLTNSRLYSITYYLGTNTASALNDDYLSCKAPGQNGEDSNYCAVEPFSISVSSGNLYLQ